MTSCKECHGPLSQSAGPGRPRIYCRPRCRERHQQRELLRLARIGRAVERALVDL